ncbi:MAG: hypothetical protein R6W78_17400 [Bacteroidales bacterium]
MKNLILFFAILFAVASCSKEDDYDNNSGIVIKGIILEDRTKSTEVKSDNPLSLSDATKVLVFSNHYYQLYDIVDGAFSVTGKVGTGVALIFLDENYKYIGNLSSQGLNMLPLGSLTNGENTSIDLSTLTLVGNSVIPSHDPFGNEIDISSAEISSLKVIGGYYASIAKNIDADNDGIPDVLSNKQLVVYSKFARYSGKWGFNESVPVPSDSSHSYINYSVDIDAGSGLTFSNDNITLSGPGDDPYNDISTWGYMLYSGNGGFTSSFNRQANAPPDAPWGTAFLPFKMGTYTLTLDGTNKYTLDYSNIDVQFNLVIISPTLHTNSEGRLTSLTFEYKLPDGTVVNPASILTNVMVQFCDNYMHQLYNSSNLTATTGFSGIDFNPPIDISSLYQIDIWYNDLLGNIYDIIWRGDN